jgi:hypothetical protein
MGHYKTTLFGIFERDGQVYAEIVLNSSKSTLQAIIQGRVDVLVINSDGLRVMTHFNYFINEFHRIFLNLTRLQFL